MLQIVEEIEERHVGTAPEELIYALIGKTSKQLLGVATKNIKTGKKRTIYFHDIDRMVKILESMSEK